MRRVQPLAAQQLADLTRPGARVRLGQDLQLVLRRERPALGLLDQLGVRHPRRRGAPAGPESQPGYASLVFAAGGSSLIRCPSSIRARLQHLRRSPFSPSRFIDSSMVSVSPDVDREGIKDLRPQFLRGSADVFEACLYGRLRLGECGALVRRRVVCEAF